MAGLGVHSRPYYANISIHILLEYVSSSRLFGNLIHFLFNKMKYGKTKTELDCIRHSVCTAVVLVNKKTACHSFNLLSHGGQVDNQYVCIRRPIKVIYCKCISCSPVHSQKYPERKNVGHFGVYIINISDHMTIYKGQCPLIYIMMISRSH